MKTATLNTFESKPYSDMPGHWLLASVGKKVLRPGGWELSTWMIEGLNISTKDDVVELAPGLGRTAMLTLEHRPHSYVGVEKDEAAASIAKKAISGKGCSIKLGDAVATGLRDASATVVYGEAFLTMQLQRIKVKILQEAARILKPGGLYGLHELALATDDADVAARVHHDLTTSIRVNAKPLSINGWKTVVEDAGFEIIKVKTVRMALLESGRLLKDEGPQGVARIILNLLRRPAALVRVLHMRKQFRKHSASLCAISIVARKK